MSQYTNKFVFAKNNIKVSDRVLIGKDDVGIIKSESKEGASVFFIKIWQQVTLNESDFQIFNFKKTGDSFSKKICNICHKLIGN